MKENLFTTDTALQIGEIRKALYGSVALLRGYCEHCERYSFVIDGRYQCCDRLVKDPKISGIDRMVEGEKRRSHISGKAKKAAIERQGNKCYWCGKDLQNTYYIRKGRVFKLRTVFDHYVPWIYSRDNSKTNIVAACHLCNIIKNDKMFDDEEQIREHIKRRIEAKGIEYV